MNNIKAYIEENYSLCVLSFNLHIQLLNLKKKLNSYVITKISPKMLISYVITIQIDATQVKR